MPSYKSVQHKCIKDGQEYAYIESDLCSGRSATSTTPKNVERVLATINKDWQLIVQEPEAEVGIPNTTESEILSQDLGMECVVANFVPQLLLPEQKEHHTAVANDLIQTATKKVIIRDESWVYGYDVEMKDLSTQWKLPGSPHWRRHGKIAARSGQC